MSENKIFLKFLILIECLEDDELINNNKKRIWAKKWFIERRKYSHMSLLKELRISSPRDLKNFLRMDSKTYNILLEKIRPHIEKKDTLLRKAITANERLTATLRFLASGNSYEDLKFLTAISPQSLGYIIIETCEAIIEALKAYIQIPKSEDQWIHVAKNFEEKWNFPNCIGAIDGKHILIKKPFGTGSYYFNYKKTFSIVLLAVVNANYEFLMVEAGSNGRVSDGGIFSNGKFGEKLNEGKLRIPDKQKLLSSDEEMPFVIVADDAFPLHKNIMKPFSHSNLSTEERIFNYRLSRARRIVENAFGILSNRFRIFLTTISLHPEKATTITLACCYLHNFLKKTNASIYLQGSVDIENITNGNIQEGSWRTENTQFLNLQPAQARNSSEEAKQIRIKFCEYFNGVGAVPWQSLRI